MVGKVIFNILQQSGLILFNTKEIVRFPFFDQVLSKVPLGVQCITRDIFILNRNLIQ